VIPALLLLREERRARRRPAEVDESATLPADASPAVVTSV
jgi:hypothetical protein